MIRAVMAEQRMEPLLPPIPTVPRDCVGGGAPVEQRPFPHKGGRGGEPPDMQELTKILPL